MILTIYGISVDLIKMEMIIVIKENGHQKDSTWVDEEVDDLLC
jgi:hypothetical protein